MVPNIRVEVPNLTAGHPSYTPYEPQRYEPEHSVPPAMVSITQETSKIQVQHWCYNARNTWDVIGDLLLI